MSNTIYRVLVLSAVKHSYVATGVGLHPRFELAVIADDADQPAKSLRLRGRLHTEDQASGTESADTQ